MYKFIVILIIILNSCSNSNKERIETVKIDSVQFRFKEFISQLPNVNLPFETTCESCCDYPKDKINEELFVEFIKPNKELVNGVVGVVSIKNDKVIILVTYSADYILPAIQVRDLNGNIISEMTYFGKYCGGEPGYYGQQYLRINQDLSITSIDTSYYFNYDSVQYFNLDTTKIEIFRKDYFINNNGVIIENNAR